MVEPGTDENQTNAKEAEQPLVGQVMLDEILAEIRLP